MADENRIWSALLNLTGGNAFGAAGLMGNLFAESALNPKNLQQSFEKKLGYTDDSYTEAVDSGAYQGFVRDGAGYGLAQWTWWSRKEALLKWARECNTSVGNLVTQLIFLTWEIQTNYGGVLDALRSATSVRAASDAVLTCYERPKDQSEAVRVKRAGYGQRYYDTYATNNGGDTQMATVKLGSARIDENGHATGGKAGDQTGREVSTQNWYKHSKGWRVFRAKNSGVAEKIAWDMQAACDNPKIGYDQSQRDTLYTVAKLVGFNCAKVEAACDTDCSALVRVCCAYAGVMLPNIRTTNEPKALLDSGEFVELTGAKYTDQADYLRRGDILCTKTQGHTVVVLSSGSKAEVAPVAHGLSRGDHGSAVEAMQEALLKWDSTCLPKYGADGDFGGETEAALKAFQASESLPVTGVYDETTRKVLKTTVDKPAGPADDGGTDSSELSDAPVQPVPGTPAKYVQVREIHVRSAPGDAYMSLGTVQPGYRLPYQGETHKDTDGVPWLLVEYDGQNGWISSAVAEVTEK
jgi:peptidoglycan hydrolase-like protein with peptidoglycan-binding domain